MKFETYREYDRRGIALAESAFITVWASLGSFHEDLVLVGGLVPKYLCGDKTRTANLPLPATLDVDIGIALAASAGQYGSISMDLAGQGFRMSEQYIGRFEKNVEGFSIYIDFLVERPGASEGAVAVDDIRANILPGINRALAMARKVTVDGTDLHGALLRLSASFQSRKVQCCRPVPKPHYSGLLLFGCEISDPVLLLSAISSLLTASNGLLEE
jgi:hypothetical protein